MAVAMDDLDRLFRHLVYLLADQDPERLHAPFEVAELYQRMLPYRQHRSALRFDTYQDYEMALLRLLSGDRGYATVEPVEVQEALRQEAEAINPDTGAFREYAAARVRLNAAAVRTALDARGAYAPAAPADTPTPHGITAQRHPPATPPPPHGMTAEREPSPAPPPPHGVTAERHPSAPPAPPHGMTAERQPTPTSPPPHGMTAEPQREADREPAPPRPVMRVVGGGRDAAGEVRRRGADAVEESAHPDGVTEPSGCPYCGEDLPAHRAVFYCPFCGGNVKGVDCPQCGTALEVGWSFCITCGDKVGRS